MTATDHLDGDIRRAVQELGDAAGLPPTYAELGGTPPKPTRTVRREVLTFLVPVARRRRRHRVAVAGAAAAIVVAGIAALVVVNRAPPGPSTVRSGSAVAGSTTVPAAGCVGSACVTTPVESSAPATVGVVGGATCDGAAACVTGPTPAVDRPGGVDSALAEAIRPALPDGFQLLAVEPNPLHAIAYDNEGTRIDLAVQLDADREMVVRDGLWEQSALGMVSTVNGSPRLLTPSGDLVTATTSFGAQQATTPAVERTKPQLRVLVDAVGTAMSGEQRAEIANMPQEWVGATRIGEAVDAALVRVFGGTLGAGSNGSGRGWLTPFVSVGDIDQVSSLSVAATFTPIRVPDSTAQLADDRSVAYRWINGWQLVLTASGADATARMNDATAEVAAVFESWTPAEQPSACGTYTVQVGDYFVGIAEKVGSTYEAVIDANDGRETLNPGDIIQLPCPAAGIQQRTNDGADLAGYLDLVRAATSDFTPARSIVVASVTDVWVLTGGSGPISGEQPDAIVGKLRVDQYDRATGQPGSTGETTMSGCAGVIEPDDDPAAPLDAIPLRCIGDGTAGTVDVFNGTSPEYAG